LPGINGNRHPSNVGNEKCKNVTHLIGGSYETCQSVIRDAFGFYLGHPTLSTSPFAAKRGI
jgi:hypothetical protein